MIHLSEISEAEEMLIDHFGVRSMLTAPGIQIIPLYRIMVEIAFMSDDKTGYSKALRNAYKHLQDGKYRMTLEFDNIILKEIKNEIRKEKLEKIKSI